MNSKKILLHTETAYIAGIILLAFGNSLMTKADLGLSMVIAPAYLLHLKLVNILPWFTFGVSEYCLQAVLLLLTALVLRRFNPSYPFSFVTAVFYGNVLDIIIRLISFIPVSTSMPVRIFFFVVGKVIANSGLAFLFRTYISPEAYELLVKEVALKFKLSISKVKTSYDIISCIVSVIMSFTFFGFGHFEGIKFGTFVVALVNGWLIGVFANLYDKTINFKDAFPRFRSFLESSTK